MRQALGRSIVHLIVFIAGIAALSWEVLWQLESSLALGISARGTALTLASTMGGMTIGSLLAGRVLGGRTLERPLRIYGLVELSIAIFGAWMEPGFSMLERIDSALYQRAPVAAPFVHFLGISLL